MYDESCRLCQSYLLIVVVIGREGRNMMRREFISVAKVFWVSILTAFAAWPAVLLSGQALAQSSCFATEVVKGIISKIGVPTSAAQLLLMALTPTSTVESLIDQLTQTSPTFADKNAKELRAEDETLDKAQKFVKTMPLTEDTQNCVGNMQEMRDNIRKELSQRDKENIPDDLSVKQLRALRSGEATRAKEQRFTPNPMSGGTPRPRTGPGNSEPGVGPNAPVGGGCAPGVDCRMNRR